MRAARAMSALPPRRPGRPRQPDRADAVIAAALAILFMLLILDLIRRDRLQERYSVIWFGAGLAMLAGAAFPGLLKLVADAMGVRDTNVALFSIVLLLLLGLALNFSVTMSRQAAQITRLAQERAIDGRASRRRGKRSKARDQRVARRDGWPARARTRATAAPPRPPGPDSRVRSLPYRYSEVSRDREVTTPAATQPVPGVGI